MQHAQHHHNTTRVMQREQRRRNTADMSLMDLAIAMVVESSSADARSSAVAQRQHHRETAGETAGETAPGETAPGETAPGEGAEETVRIRRRLKYVSCEITLGDMEFINCCVGRLDDAFFTNYWYGYDILLLVLCT